MTNVEYSSRKRYTSSRVAPFIVQGGGMKVVPMRRKKGKTASGDLALLAKKVDASIGTITPKFGQADQQVDWSKVFCKISMFSSGAVEALRLTVKKSEAFQQVSRPSMNLAGILDKYRLKDGKTVLLFLKEHVDVSNFLIESYRQIRRRFPSSPLWLRVSQDPEDSQLRMLVLSIMTKYAEVDEAYEKFTALEDDWLLDASSEVSDRLCIKLDFE